MHHVNQLCAVERARLNQLCRAVETIFYFRALPGIFGHAPTRGLFTCQRAPSTSNGRAARQGYQWRNIFRATLDGGAESTKEFRLKGRFSLQARCAARSRSRSALRTTR